VIQEQRDASDNSDSQQLMKEKSAQFERQMRIASNSILSVIGVVERREKQKQVASHAGAGEARSPLGAPYDDAIILRKYLPGLLASHWVGGLYLRLLVSRMIAFSKEAPGLKRDRSSKLTIIKPFFTMRLMSIPDWVQLIFFSPDSHCFSYSLLLINLDQVSGRILIMV
jgi:hypothetical protein